MFTASEPVTGTRPVPPRLHHHDGPEAPNVHATIRPAALPHGAEGLSRPSHAGAWLSPNGRPDGAPANLPHDENAAAAWTQAGRGRPEPAQRTTAAAPAPASVPTGMLVHPDMKRHAAH